jgi:hypothetical protein
MLKIYNLTQAWTIVAMLLVASAIIVGLTDVASAYAPPDPC